MGRFSLFILKRIHSVFCLPCSGQSSRTVSSSPSIESLSGGRGQCTASPPLPPSRGSDVSTSSPPLSANKKESFFNIARSRSHSKTMGKKETVRCAICSSSFFFILSDSPHVFVCLPSVLFSPSLYLYFLCGIQSMSDMHVCVCVRIGWRPGSTDFFPAGSDQWPGGHEQVLCQDDEHTHLWVHLHFHDLKCVHPLVAG